MRAWDLYWPPVAGRTYFGRRRVDGVDRWLVYWRYVTDQPLHNWRNRICRTRADNWVTWCAAQARKGVPMFEEKTP